MTGVAMLVALDIDPSVVRPGWIPLVITVAMAGVLVLLFKSMRRQFRRITVPPSPGARGRISRAMTLPAPDDEATPEAPTPRGSASRVSAEKTPGQSGSSPKKGSAPRPPVASDAAADGPTKKP